MEIFIFDSRRQHFTIIAPYKFTLRHSSESCLFFIGNNMCRTMLEADKEQVSLKSYCLKMRVHSVNQILLNKEKVT